MIGGIGGAMRGLNGFVAQKRRKPHTNVESDELMLISNKPGHSWPLHRAEADPDALCQLIRAINSI